MLLLLNFVTALIAQNEEKYVRDPDITAQIAANPKIIHEQLIKSMRKILENPATLTIEIDEYDLTSTSLGHFKKIRVKTSRGEVDNLILDKADIEFEDVTLNTTKLLKQDKIDPVEMKNINMDVVIKESDMNSFLNAKSRSIKVNNPRVKMKPGAIELSGEAKYGLVKVKFWATGIFSIKKAKEIWFHAKRMKINHMSMPRSFTGMIVKKINPVFDLDKFPFRLNLSEIRIDNGKMVFTSFRKGTKQ
ncbi:MAG: hypothetical protein Kow0029_04240 [Candidatus Rifleibacteriota bacterium]